MIFGKVVCFFKGHKRGKLVTTTRFHEVPFAEPLVEGRPPSLASDVRQEKLPIIVDGKRIYRCPRCGHETRYKVKNGTRPTTDS